MHLRPYQNNAITGIQEKFKSGKKKIVLVMVTAAGKTVVASRMIQMAVKNKSKILFLAHRSELIEQCHEKLKSFGIDAGIIMAGVAPNKSLPVQVASIQTLARREKPPANFIIIDECHNSISKEYLAILRYYEETYKSFFVGLSATPFRTSRRQGLNEFYEDFVYPVTPQELIDNGFIVPARIFACARIVTDGIKKSKGEFDDKELMKFFDTSDVYKNLISNFHTHIGTKKTIVFCCNIQHSKNTVEALNASGYKAIHVDGTFSKKERDGIVTAFRLGVYQVMSNCAIFTEGTDIQDVEAIVLNMATTSKIKYIQASGRGLRSFPGKKECIILDMADNAARFGFPTDAFEVSLEPANTSDKEGVAPVKDCPQCGFMMPVQLRVCPECKTDMPVQPKTKKEIKEEIFVELDKKKLEVRKYLHGPVADVPSDLLKAYAEAKLFSSPTGWVKHELARRGEGQKQVKILKYIGTDYYKWRGWLQKAYYQKIPIDAEMFTFVKETDGEIIYEYRLAEKESIIG